LLQHIFFISVFPAFALTKQVLFNIHMLYYVWDKFCSRLHWVSTQNMY